MIYEVDEKMKDEEKCPKAKLIIEKSRQKSIKKYDIRG